MSATQEVQEIFGHGKGPAHAMLRSPTVLIASIGLWGMNVYLFRVFGIDYVKVLKHDLLKLEEQDMGSNSQHGVPHQQHKRARSNGNSSGGGNRGNGGGGGGMLVARKDNSEYGVDNCDASFASDNVSKSGGGGGNAPTDPVIFEDDEMAIMEAPLDDYSHADRITSGRLIWLSFTLLLLLHSTYTIWIHWLGGGSISAVFAFYGAVTTAIMLPLPSTRWLRTSALLVIQRALELVNPRCYCCSRKHVMNDEAGVCKAPRPIPFVDVFFADAMCSLSKVFFDWGLLLHMAAYYPRPVPKSVWHILIPSAAAAVPYIIRARQCLVMWSVTSLKNDPGRYQHLWNALKYCTSIFPLCLSAYQKTVSKDFAAQLEVYLIFLLVVNAAYALWWDVGTWIISDSRRRCPTCSYP
jgi:EXS family